MFRNPPMIATYRSPYDVVSLAQSKCVLRSLPCYPLNQFIFFLHVFRMYLWFSQVLSCDERERGKSTIRSTAVEQIFKIIHAHLARFDQLKVLKQ